MQLSIGQCATLACILEATAPKPGNVHRGSDFEDLSFTDFLVSATAIGPVLELATTRTVGQTVFDAICATRRMVSTNTNLGIVLLLAPLAAVPREQPLAVGVLKILAGLTEEDCRLVYAAIQRAQPGGLGKAAAMDVHDTPPADLLAAMQLAAPRDLVARQYVAGFRLVLDSVVPWLLELQTAQLPLTQAIVHVQMRLLSEFPDSLIARKCGDQVAAKVSAMAAEVLASGPPGDDDYLRTLADFDFWLRADGHRRNPGTTADLLAAGLFAALRDDLLQPPFR